MDPTKPIPVRFSDSTIERLDRTAKEIGNTRAGLMRYLIEVWLDGFDVHGKGVVAKEWPELIRSFDERRQAKKEQKVPPAWANGGIDPKTGELSSEVNAAVLELVKKAADEAANNPPVVFGRKRRAG